MIQIRNFLCKQNRVREFLAMKPHISHTFKALIISENTSEIVKTEKNLTFLGYEIEIAHTLNELIGKAHEWFDVILISTQLQSVGINFASLLFQTYRGSGEGLPRQYLLTNLHDFSGGEKEIETLMKYHVVDGLMYFH
jgi:hypothetical protein